MNLFFDENVVVHTHIEKTAGSTLVRGLTRAFGADRVYDIRSSKFPPPEALPAEVRHNIFVLTGHFHYGSHDRFFDRTKIYIACVRPALERFRSYYNFVAARTGHPGHQKIAGKSFGQVVEESLRADNAKTNAMSRAITGLARPDLKEIFEFLEDRYLIVSPHTQVNETLSGIIGLFGGYADPVAIHANKGSKTKFDDIGALAQRFNEANSLDNALYDYVSDRYGDWIGNLGNRLGNLKAPSFAGRSDAKLSESGDVRSSTSSRAGAALNTVSEIPLKDFVDQRRVVPLVWNRVAGPSAFAHLRDSIGPLLVSSLTGLPLEHRNVSDSRDRLVAASKIVPDHQGGGIHFWGASAGVDVMSGRAKSYTPLPYTSAHVHSVRGPYTSRALKDRDLLIPEIYGDPILFLPKIVGPASASPKWELGIIVDGPELETKTPDSSHHPSLIRYVVPPDLKSSICVISPYAEPGLRGFVSKINQIRACKRIVSVSAIGVLVAEALNIPCAWFAKYSCGAATVAIDDQTVRVDARIRDFYSGVGRNYLSYFGVGAAKSTDWRSLMEAVDLSWKPLNFNMRPVFEAFPLDTAVSFEDDDWPVNSDFYGGFEVSNA